MIKEFFRKFGMSLSEGLNYLLKKTLKNEKDLGLVKIEPIDENDPDYEIAKRAKERYKKHPEDYVDFDEIKWV